jgi:four helix bundle protein
MNDDGSKYKFQRLRVYQLALDHVDAVYGVTHSLPNSEVLNLRSQLQRAATSVVLNIAEGSTGQSDAEQSRFLGLALRSLVECVACFDMVERHHYSQSAELAPVKDLGHELFVKIQAMRRALQKKDD